MDRLSIILTLLTGAVLTGGLVVAAFSLGFINWFAIAAAAVVGFALSWPSAFLISRLIKRQDPAWKDDKLEKVDSTIPRKDAPEV